MSYKYKYINFPANANEKSLFINRLGVYCIYTQDALKRILCVSMCDASSPNLRKNKFVLIIEKNCSYIFIFINDLEGVVYRIKILNVYKSTT